MTERLTERQLRGLRIGAEIDERREGEGRNSGAPVPYWQGVEDAISYMLREKPGSPYGRILDRLAEEIIDNLGLPVEQRAESLKNI